jgi:hypothetical protein
MVSIGRRYGAAGHFARPPDTNKIVMPALVAGIHGFFGNSGRSGQQKSRGWSAQGRP